MIAKIGRSSNLYGALAYNNIKVEKQQGQIIMCNKIIETALGSFTASQLLKSFEPYLLANRNTEKHTIHISLNPDPRDEVTDEMFCEMALQYMDTMGYGEQPFVVFKHTDLDRSHIHIVSVCVDENGRKIADKFEKSRSMEVCRELENKHGLVCATEKDSNQNEKTFSPVDHLSGDVKSQIASVVRHLPSYYKFQTLGEYNALLSLFNITAEKVEGTADGRNFRGLVYSAVDEKGNKTGIPFKASLFGKKAGLDTLEKHFESCKIELKNSEHRNSVKAAIKIAMQQATDDIGFKGILSDKGINLVVRRNETERIYGVTFIDHNSKTVWNGSRLGKEFSANVFNELWKDRGEVENDIGNELQPVYNISNNTEATTEEPHKLFDLTIEQFNYDQNLVDAFASLLPDSQAEDYEEQDFANRMKRKKRNRSK